MGEYFHNRLEGHVEGMKEDIQRDSWPFLSHLVCSVLLRGFIGRSYMKEGAMGTDHT